MAPGPRAELPPRTLTAALRACPDGVAIIAPGGSLAWANDAFLRAHGLPDGGEPRDLLGGRPWTALYPDEERRRLEREVLPTLRARSGWAGRARGRRVDGRPFPQRLWLTPLDDGGLVAVIRDIERDGRAERALAAREELFRLLADNATDVIALHEPDGTYIYVSPSAGRLLGRGPAELLGRLPWELAGADQRERVRACYAAAADGEPRRVTWRLGSAVDGSRGIRWFETAAQPVRRAGTEDGTDGPPFQVQTTSRDITERKELERALAHRALHDPLTELANRSLFLNRLDQAGARTRRSGGRYGVLFLDLNGFKAVNDSLGHAAGDALLVETARRLEGVVRESDTVARLGGDEFGILLEGVDDQAALRTLVERVRGAFEEPFLLGGGPTEAERAEIRPSIGVALGGTGWGGGPEDDPRELLRRADRAMYRAKRSGARAPAFDASAHEA